MQTQSQPLMPNTKENSPLNGLKRLALWLLPVLVLCACATPPAAKVPVQVEPVRLPPAPAAVLAQREPNFQKRLLDFFSPSPEKLTK